MSSDSWPSLRLITCLLLWIGLLLFGLWPFNFFPPNKVVWDHSSQGLVFDHYGQIYSLGEWAMQPSPAEGRKQFSLEFWLQPQAGYQTYSDILCICSRGVDSDLIVGESGPDLVVIAPFRNRDGTTSKRSLWFDGAAEKVELRFLTVTSGPEGTVLYLDGKPWHADRYRDLLPERYSGQLVMGHSLSGEQGWRGVVHGLALYDHALSVQEVAVHYSHWQQNEIEQLRTAAALYTFEAHTGNLIRNRAASSAPDLIIPLTFRRFRLKPLEFPHPLKRSDIRDAMVNVLGFVPFGFYLYLYLRTVRDFSAKKAALCAISIGAVTSLTIELSQVFLPTRDSSALDLMNNIIGTLAGSLVAGLASGRCCRWLILL